MSDLEAHWIQETNPTLTDKSGERIDKQTKVIQIYFCVDHTVLYSIFKKF